jgi:hypothetical protein
MTKAEEPSPIKPEAEIVGPVDQSETMLEGDGCIDVPGRTDEDVEGTAWAFEEKAEQAETDAALERVLEGTFPTSDPSSSWAGPDVEPERPEDQDSSVVQITGDDNDHNDAEVLHEEIGPSSLNLSPLGTDEGPGSPTDNQ